MKKITFLFLIFGAISLNSQTKLTSSLWESLSNGVYSNSSRTQYTYDNANNLSEELYQDWNAATSQWISSDKTIYVYNSSNKVTSETYQSFNADNSSFEFEDRTIYTYNSEGNLIQLLGEEYVNSTWVNTFKFDLVYVNGKISSGLSYEWSGSDWVFGEDSSRLTMSYANDKISSFTSDERNDTNDAWVNSARTVFTYDTNNNITLQENQDWDGSNWVVNSKDEFTYDSNGNAITAKSSYIENNVFVVSSEDTISFDTTQLISNFAHPFKNKDGLDPALTEQFGVVNKILSRSSSAYRITYNYGEATANVNDFNFTDFSVFPNPSNSIVNIDDSSFSLKNVQIYNILGKVEISSNNNKINISTLKNGVYSLRIESEDGKFASRKIIKN